MKFLHLFGKSTSPPLRHVRQSPRAGNAAEETTRKIDAIESEISAELAEVSSNPDEQRTPTAQLMQRIDEASLLYASRQTKAAESLLLDAVEQPSNSAHEPLAWMMLLELACAAGSQAQFEALALRYAQRFETSPPQWRDGLPEPATPTVRSPVLAYRGKLSSSAAPALGRLAQMAGAHDTLRIDLDGVTTVDDEGCTLLLNLLEQWLADGRQVELLPSPALVALLRAQLDEAKLASSPNEAHDRRHSRWRLLLELLYANGETSAHDEACVAYSIAYEVSPPAPLLSLPPSTSAAVSCADTLTLPVEITYPVDALLESLHSMAAPRSAIVLDCRYLQLIEFNAAAPLLAGLARLADGKPVEWRDLSHLVSTLLQLVGGADRLRIINRKP